MSGRLLSRPGVVREVTGGCATVDLGVPCGGCSQAGCGARQTARHIQLSASDLVPGDRVQLSLPVRSLTRASLAVFGPPLFWLVLAGVVLAIYPERWAAATAFGPVLFGCGMVGALALGGWLGRRIGRTLALNQVRVASAGPGNTPVTPLEPSYGP